MKKKYKLFSAISIFLASGYAWSGNTLYSNNLLNPGQYIESSDQRYKLIMQTDGSLVMYRSDGSVRYRMAKNGWIAAM